MMAGTALATENVIEVKSGVTITQQENVVDRLIKLIEGYTKQISAAKTLDELMAVAVKCEEEMTAFEEKYADEIMAFEGTLTEEQMEKYEAKLEQVLEAFEAAAEKKAEELIGEFEFEDAES
jgi:DNA-binding transcriptional regulator YbjK